MSSCNTGNKDRRTVVEINLLCQKKRWLRILTARRGVGCTTPLPLWCPNISTTISKLVGSIVWILYSHHWYISLILSKLWELRMNHKYHGQVELLVPIWWGKLAQGYCHLVVHQRVTWGVRSPDSWLIHDHQFSSKGSPHLQHQTAFTETDILECLRKLSPS